MREFDGRRYLLERGLTADFALVKAWRGIGSETLSTGKRRGISTQ